MPDSNIIKRSMIRAHLLIAGVRYIDIYTYHAMPSDEKGRKTIRTLMEERKERRAVASQYFISLKSHVLVLSLATRMTLQTTQLELP